METGSAVMVGWTTCKLVGVESSVGNAACVCNATMVCSNCCSRALGVGAVGMVSPHPLNATVSILTDTQYANSLYTALITPFADERCCSYSIVSHTRKATAMLICLAL